MVKKLPQYYLVLQLVHGVLVEVSGKLEVQGAQDWLQLLW